VIDESFHLTPLDVRRTEFPAALRGYDRARVDEFRDRVANELERLTRLNHELDNKAKGFHEQLRAFRERDKALNEALVSAQQLRTETRQQAEREAGLALREAKAEGDRLIDAAKAEVRRLAGEIEALERSRRAYLAQLRSLVARQLAEIDAIPAQDATRPEGFTVPAAPPAAASPAPAEPAVKPREPKTGEKTDRKEPTNGGSRAPVPGTAGAASSAPPPPPPTAAPASVSPRTNTVPLATVPPNGAEPEAKKADEKEAQKEGSKETAKDAAKDGGPDNANPRENMQTPAWLKTVASSE
jgi:cell division initiation protein